MQGRDQRGFLFSLVCLLLLRSYAVVKAAAAATQARKSPVIPSPQFALTLQLSVSVVSM